MSIQTAVNNSLGFDVDSQLSASEAAAFKEAGYSFCIRYVPRSAALANNTNVTKTEMGIILAAKLSLMLVQHVALPGWEPSADLGKQYGEYAASYAKDVVGFPVGPTIWLDLEMVASGTVTSDVINYCINWFNAVCSAGYTPGLYVGYTPGLTPDQLYKDLPFKSYWRAYNYEDGVSVRGFQILQQTQEKLNGIIFDPNKIVMDNLGGLPILLSSD